MDKCEHTFITDKNGFKVCSECGLVDDEGVYTPASDQEYNLFNKDVLISEPVFLGKGSIIKTHNQKYKNMRNLQNQYSDNQILKFKKELLLVNSVLQLNEQGKYKIMEIYKKDIKPYAKKSVPLLYIVVTAALFYYRNQKIPIDIRYIVKELNKNGYTLKSNSILKVLESIPDNIRRKYPRPSIESNITYCLTKVFSYIQTNGIPEKLKIGSDEIQQIYSDTREEITKYCQEREEKDPFSSTHYNIFISAIIYDMLKDKKLIRQIDFEGLFNITQCALRGVFKQVSKYKH